MTYKGTLKDINDSEYIVTIGEESNNYQEITFPFDSPLSISISGDTENVFKPVLYGSGTLTIVSDSYIPDLYNSGIDTKVTVYSTDIEDIVFNGFISPELYNQDYVTDSEKVDINLIDGLAALQYKDYIAIDNVPSFRSVAKIIYNILSQIGIYKYFYLPHNFVLDERDLDYTFQEHISIYRECKLNEESFFDEDNQPMKCNEVLEEICRYFGMTAFAVGENIYFMSYDCLTNNQQEYFFYSLSYPINQFESNEVKRTLSAQTANISKYFVNSNNTELSLGEVYNRFKVISSFYNVDELLPDLWENSEDITIPTPFEERLCLLPSQTQTYQGWWILTKYFKNNNLVLQNGVYAYDWFTFGIKSVYGQNYYTQLISQQVHTTSGTSLSDTDTKFISDLNGNYLCVHKGTSTDTQEQLKRFTIVSTKNNLYESSEKLLINFDVKFYKVLNAWPASKGVVDASQPSLNQQGYCSNDTYLDDCPVNEIVCSLKVGNKYWNGSNWSNLESTFAIPLDTEQPKSPKIDSNVNFYDNVKKAGWLIPMQNGLAGTIQFTVFAPVYNNSDSAIFFKDFSTKILNTERYTTNEDSKDDDNTVYENIGDENAINDYEEIECKITTWDDKEPDISSVLVGGTSSDSPYKYLQNLYNVNDNSGYVAEQHIIKRYLAEYKQPQLCLTSDIKFVPQINCIYNLDYATFSNKNFVVNSYIWDVKQNNCTVTFKEIFSNNEL